ncbi:MAG TPA: undecaprenyl-phosphate glucose phosphotransferase, partial [Gammaproteobacteria bacterium]|nr:undecaprenyl-phosphate glucose phosphotransferase [Gammaproteobacteria bacterium]
MHTKRDIQLAVLATVRGLLPPVVSTAALVASANALDVRWTQSYVVLALISAMLVWIAIGRDQQQGSAIPASSLALAGQTVVEWSAVVATLLLIAYATKTSAGFSRRALFLWFMITPPLLVVALAIVHAWMRAITASPRNARRAVIIGESHMGERLAAVINTRPELGLRLDRVFDVRESPLRHAPRKGDPSAVGRERISEYVNRRHIDVAFIALPIESAETRAILDGLRDTTASVYALPDIALYDLIQARSDEIEGIPIIALCESPLQGMRGLTKRGTDLVFASLLTLCSLPIMLGIAAAIKLTSPGPIIFKQHRYGLDGERITVYKFRTMTVTENGRKITQARRGDPRVTSVGRFLRRTSLDELPQLFNVLGGSMSLVGPRPHAVAHNEQYRKLVRGYMVRHKVAPGITGLAQVNGCRGETATVDEMRRRVEYDLE